MADITANPVASTPGEDTFTSANAVSGSYWNLNPTTLPTGYTYNVYSAVGEGGLTPRPLTQGVQVDLGNAATQLTAYITYTQDGTTNEVRFTNPVPASTGASMLWNPGAGMRGAPQPSITITVVTEKPDF